jgi:multidrug efflux pump
VHGPLFGRFFHWFNRFFQRRSPYGRGVTGILKRKSLALVVYALLLRPALLFTRIPSGFVPAPDKQYLIGVAQLPAGSAWTAPRR